MKLIFTKRIRAIVQILMVAQFLLNTACSVLLRPPKTITIASKSFSEELILGEMYSQLLEYNGFKVNLKLGMGETPDLQQAILSGQIDLYPEYTGTALLTVLKLPSESDPKKVYDLVASQYKKLYNLVWLDAAPMNNTQALAMTQAGSKQLGITTISELAAKADQIIMAGPPEFRQREDGLPGLKKAYGNFYLFEYKDVDPSLRYQILTSGQADVVVAFSTDGEISTDNLVILKDDKHFYPPYQVAPVIRQQVLDKYPEIKDILNKLAPLLTDEVMRKLNYQATGLFRDPANIAKDFLTQQGLIKSSD